VEQFSSHTRTALSGKGKSIPHHVSVSMNERADVRHRHYLVSRWDGWNRISIQCPGNGAHGSDEWRRTLNQKKYESDTFISSTGCLSKSSFELKAGNSSARWFDSTGSHTDNDKPIRL
jgi:hypothetical protein